MLNPPVFCIYCSDCWMRFLTALAGVIPTNQLSEPTEISRAAISSAPLAALSYLPRTNQPGSTPQSRFTFSLSCRNLVSLVKPPLRVKHIYRPS